MAWQCCSRLLLGSAGRWTILGCIFISQIGTCTAYLIFFANVIHTTWSEVSRYWALVMALALVFPLVLFRDLRSLRWTSFFGCVVTAVAVGVVVAYESARLNEYPTPETPKDPEYYFNSDILHWPRFFGIAVFAIEGITLILPLEQAMSNKEKFLPTMYGAMGCVTLLLMGFGIMGSLTFGSATKNMVTENLPDNVYVTILNFLLLLALVVTFPIQLFPVTQLLDGCLLPPPASPGNYELHFSIRALLCVLIAHLAWLLPNFGDILAVVGGLSLYGIGVIFPCIIYMNTFKGGLGFASLAGLILLVAHSLALSILVTTTSIWDLAENKLGS